MTTSQGRESLDTLARTDPPVPDGRSSEGQFLVRLTTALGIEQKGSLILETEARPFHLPAERTAVEDVVRRLREVAERVEQSYPFKRGMGLAAPQIGIGRRAVLIRPERGENWIELINPTVLTMDGTEVHYEGCLSFFGVRGLVTRPSHIDVEHTALSGGRTVSSFGKGTAGLVMHEIDHIDGMLYDRLVVDSGLLSVAEYRKLTAKE